MTVKEDVETFLCPPVLGLAIETGIWLDVVESISFLIKVSQASFGMRQIRLTEPTQPILGECCNQNKGIGT